MFVGIDVESIFPHHPFSEHDYFKDPKIEKSNDIGFSHQKKANYLTNKNTSLQNEGICNNVRKRNCKNLNFNHKEKRVKNSESFNQDFNSTSVPAAQLPISALEMINNFHEKLEKIKINQCSVCKQAWFNIKGDTCQRCKTDKGNPQKFSLENEMIPSPIPEELKYLTQIEEMLIARVFPLINVYHKPCGGQRAYKGHVISFHADVQKVAKVLPNLLSEIPIVKIKQLNKEFCKIFRIRKQFVLNALLWLKNNNPVYQDIVIDYERVENLPDDKILNDNDLSENISDDENDVPCDLGPVDLLDDVRPEQISSFIPL